MRILLADSLSDSAVLSLRADGHEVALRPGANAATLPDEIADADVLVVRSTRVTRAVFEAGRRLGLVVRAGAGTNTIDVSAASEHGVFVANCPGQNSIAVAELTIGFLHALDRRIAEAAADAREGRWRKGHYSNARGLCGRTLGLVGLGRIAQEVALRARAAGMRVIAWTPNLDDARAQRLGVERALSLDALASESDAVSMHLPYRREMKGFFGSSFFGAMRHGAIFINTARGELVDEVALCEAVTAHGLRVGLDVLDGEPEQGDAPLTSAVAQLPGVLVTPHIGASTAQAQEAIAAEAVRVIRAFVHGDAPPNCVNLMEKSPARFALTVRHYDRVGVLAGVLDVLRACQINVKEVTNRIFAGGGTACCQLALDSEPPDGVLDELRRRVDQVIAVEKTEL